MTAAHFEVDRDANLSERSARNANFGAARRSAGLTPGQVRALVGIGADRLDEIERLDACDAREWDLLRAIYDTDGFGFERPSAAPSNVRRCNFCHAAWIQDGAPAVERHTRQCDVLKDMAAPARPRAGSQAARPAKPTPKALVAMDVARACGAERVDWVESYPRGTGEPIPAVVVRVDPLRHGEVLQAILDQFRRDGGYPRDEEFSLQFLSQSGEEAWHRGLSAGTELRGTRSKQRIVVDQMEFEWAFVHHIRKGGLPDRRFRDWSGRLARGDWEVV